MPKRSSVDLGAGDMPLSERVPPVKAQKTERSHEENQERAYIAASRRADRSLEARVQSARMASEIHRRRTGRGLKVTEEIVIKEEMYEEEEDDLPRQYKYLTAHLQTNSPTMNHRLNAYITSQTAMATVARYNEVSRLFQESFPSAAAYQQQLGQSVYMAPLVNNGNVAYAPVSPNQSQISSPASPHGDLSRRVSIASASTSTSNLTPSATAAVSSPPPLSPSGTTPSSEARSTPCQPTSQMYSSVNPQLKPKSSIFTSELPNHTKSLIQIDQNDAMAPFFYGGNTLPMFDHNSDDFFNGVTNSGFCVQMPYKQQQEEEEASEEPEISPQDASDLRDLNDECLHSPTDPDGFSAFSNLYDGIDTPAMADGWDNWINFDQ